MSYNHQQFLIHKLQQIKLLQDAIQEPDWFKKLFLTTPLKDTIPFLLYLNNGQIFRAYGNICPQKGSDCFTTPFFRIEDIEDGFTTLRLLKPIYEGTSTNQEICDVIGLEKSPFCVDVTINLFGGIQFLSPSLVK
jgi:hypothetical protein